MPRILLATVCSPRSGARASAWPPARAGWGYGIAATSSGRSALPRVLAGFGAGAALALAGALMQLLTRNALADPYVLGVSGGASVGALAAICRRRAAGAAACGVGRGRRAPRPARCGAAVLLFALLWRVLARQRRRRDAASRRWRCCWSA